MDKNAYIHPEVWWGELNESKGNKVIKLQPEILKCFADAFLHQVRINAYVGANVGGQSFTGKKAMEDGFQGNNDK